MENKNQNTAVSSQPFNRGAAGIVSPNSSQTQAQTQSQTAQTPVQNAAADSRYYPIENLETPDTATLDQSKNINQQNTQQNSQFSSQFQAKTPNKTSRSKGIIAGIVVFGVVASAIAGWLWFRSSQNAQQGLSQQIPEQSVELTGAESGLAGLSVDTAASQVLINGNVVAKGSLYVSGSTSDTFGQLTVDNLSQSRTYTLPDSSGTICLDSNNCNYATTADIVTTSVAGITGAVQIQGTTNQVNVSANGNIISLALPQSIGTSSSPTFNSVTLKNVGKQNGNILCDISNNCGYAGSSNAFVQGGNAFGTTATLGTTDNQSLSFITNGTTRLSLGELGGSQLAYLNVDTILAQSLSDTTTALRVTNSSFSDVFVVDTLNKRARVGASPGVISSVFSVEGTVSNEACNFGCWGIYSNTTASHTTAQSNYGGARIGYSTAASPFTLTNGYGLLVSAASLGAGSTITNNYGLRIASQSAGSSDYGIAIGAADTQTLWLSDTVDNTTASAGVAFGLSRDTNLYRSAANTLKTDDSLTVGGSSLTLEQGTLTVVTDFGASDSQIDVGINCGGVTCISLRAINATPSSGTRSDIRRSSTGLGFYVGSTSGAPSEALFINNSLTGVGIGDESPDAYLEVSANGGANPFLMLSSDDENDGDILSVGNSGTVTWGGDTNLYRSDANTLTTDNYLTVGQRAAIGTSLDLFGFPTTLSLASSHTDTGAMGIYNSLNVAADSLQIATPVFGQGTLITLGGSQDFDSAVAGVNTAVYEGTATVSTLQGAGASATNQGAGTVGTLLGLSSNVSNTGLGTVDTAIGIRIEGITGSDITDVYGVYINDQSGAGTNSSYNLYSEGGGYNLFQGHTAIGADAIPDISFISTGSTYSSVLTVAEELTDFSADVNSGVTTHLLVAPSSSTGNTVVGSEVRIEVDSANTNDIGSVIGRYNMIDLAGSNHAFDAVYGLYSDTQVSGDNVSGFNHLGGYFTATNNSAGGTTSLLSGLVVGVSTGAGATSDTSVGLNIQGLNSGTVTDHYGLSISDQSGVGSGYSENIRSSGASSLNSFEGHIGIGVDASTTYKLNAQSDASGGYVANFFNDGNNQDRHGVRIQAGADDGSGTTYYLDAYDGDGTQVGYLANVAGTFGVTDVSDIRTKTNISDTSADASDILSQLHVVDYNRIQNPDGPLITGFIAQEVQDVYGQAVTVGADGYLGIMKDAFIPILVKGHQDQQAQIDDIKGQLQSTPSAASSVAQSSDFTELSVSGAATINTLDVTGSATVATLTVTGSATFNGDIAIAGNLELSGKILGNQSTRGKVTVPSGVTEIEHTFSSPFSAIPNVILTPTNDFAPPYRVEATQGKFTVYLESSAAIGITFNYQVQQ